MDAYPSPASHPSGSNSASHALSNDSRTELNQQLEIEQAIQRYGTGQLIMRQSVPARFAESTFLWDPYIPNRALTCLGGRNETGKSTFLCDISARVTSGRPMPNTHTQREPRHVLFLSYEEDADTTEKKHINQGGDPALFHVLRYIDKDPLREFRNLLGQSSSASAEIFNEIQNEWQAQYFTPLAEICQGDASVDIHTKQYPQFTQFIPMPANISAEQQQQLELEGIDITAGELYKLIQSHMDNAIEKAVMAHANQPENLQLSQAIHNALTLYRDLAKHIRRQNPLASVEEHLIQEIKLPDDIGTLRKTCYDLKEQTGIPVGLLVIDPITLAISGNSNSDTALSALLAGLQRLADELDIAVLFIKHHRKKDTSGSDKADANERISGSNAIANYCRSIMHVGWNPYDDTSSKKIVTHSKGNKSAEHGKGMEYVLRSSGDDRWQGEYEDTAYLDYTAFNLTIDTNATLDTDNSLRRDPMFQMLRDEYENLLLKDGYKSKQELLGHAKSCDDSITANFVTRTMKAMNLDCKRIQSPEGKFLGACWFLPVDYRVEQAPGRHYIYPTEERIKAEGRAQAELMQAKGLTYEEHTINTN